MNISQEIGLSIFFPVYNDEHTIRHVTEKCIRVAQQIAQNYEIIIVDDCSPDQSGKIADELSAHYPCVRVVHHETNKGYGAAIQTGLNACRFEWICFTDGDDEYDIEDLFKLWKVKEYYDLIITFRYVKLYSSKRVFISWVYNKLLRILFRTPYRDISTGLRLVRKEVISDISLSSNSPFIGAEITIKTMLKGYRVGEVGIQTFPRQFGRGNAASFHNIIKTMKDMKSIYRKIFSPDYDLPPHRSRQ